MTELHSESPLAQIETPQGLAVTVREITSRGMIDLRGNDPAFLAAVSETLGISLPQAPRSSISWGDIKILWLSTDQWLILCPHAKVAELLARLKAALAQIHSLAVDVSDMRAVIRIEGEGSREVLLKGTSLDLLGPDYPQGTVRRARFAEIGALLHIVEDNVIDLYVFRSYARYAWEFLLAAAREPAKIRLFGKQAAT